MDARTGKEVSPMHAHRSLLHSTYRVIVHPKKRIQLYENPELRSSPTLLELGELIGTGTFVAVLTTDGWLLNNELGGLPVRKKRGLRSFEDAWDHEVVDLERLEAGRGVTIDDLGEVWCDT